jgi:hypothetical protein
MKKIYILLLLAGLTPTLCNPVGAKMQDLIESSQDKAKQALAEFILDFFKKKGKDYQGKLALFIADLQAIRPKPGQSAAEMSKEGNFLEEFKRIEKAIIDEVGTYQSYQIRGEALTYPQVKNIVEGYFETKTNNFLTRVWQVIK